VIVVDSISFQLPFAQLPISGGGQNGGGRAQALEDAAELEEGTDEDVLLLREGGLGGVGRGRRGGASALAAQVSATHALVDEVDEFAGCLQLQLFGWPRERIYRWWK